MKPIRRGLVLCLLVVLVAGLKASTTGVPTTFVPTRFAPTTFVPSTFVPTTFVPTIVSPTIVGPTFRSAQAQAQTQEFDLLIRGGHVIDPRNNINAVMDVAVTGNTIALVASNIAPARVRQVADA